MEFLRQHQLSIYLSIAANSHHERYDGHGYPEGLKGDDIPEIARIISVADSYDAMTSKRRYRDPIPQQKVREEIVKGTGTQFDPVFAKIMLHLIDLDKEEEPVAADYIPRIAPEINYITGPEGDVPSIQIDDWRSATTEGLLVKERMTISFHTMSLPTARLIWHCPYIVLYYSADKQVNGPDYKEFALIRLDGEHWESDGQATNNMIVNKNDDFEDWETWKKLNKTGMDCKVEIYRESHRITVITENAGIQIRNVTIMKEDIPEIYVSLTGDQCVLTNIRIS